MNFKLIKYRFENQSSHFDYNMYEMELHCVYNGSDIYIYADVKVEDITHKVLDIRCNSIHNENGRLRMSFSPEMKQELMKQLTKAKL